MDKTIKEELNQDGCENLCVAVVKQAARDYKKALRVLSKNPNNVKAKATADECELFFEKYADNWTDIDGKMIVKAIRAEVAKGEVKEKST